MFIQSGCESNQNWQSTPLCSAVISHQNNKRVRILKTVCSKIHFECRVYYLTSMCAAGPAGRVNVTSSSRVYLGLCTSEGKRCVWVQLGQEEGWQGLESARQRPWKGHHCCSGGQEDGGEWTPVSLGTHTATGAHTTPPQPERQMEEGHKV